MKEIKFPEWNSPLVIPTDGFMSQWCCKCGARHIWHFIVMRDKDERKDEIYVDCFRDAKGEALRKFYEKNKKPAK